MIDQHSGKTQKRTATPPTFFRLSVEEARRGHRAEFEVPAYHLALHLWTYLSDDYDEIEAALSSLESRLSEGGNAGILDWFDREFPMCMALIPQDCRDEFVKGSTLRSKTRESISRLTGSLYIPGMLAMTYGTMTL